LLVLRRDPALQPSLRDVEQKNQSMLAAGGHPKTGLGNLFRMRTIYVSTRRLSTMII
jgi:hypothetical protein